MRDERGARAPSLGVLVLMAWRPAALAGLALLVAGAAGIASVLLLAAVAGANPARGELDAGLLGIPPVVLDAYLNAELLASTLGEGCAVRWQIVAGIGQVESGHGRHGGAAALPDGTVAPPIVGPALDGAGGNARIPDTDGGRWDADAVWDRAVGPMQFIPTSWQSFGQDGNGDGVLDPHNVYDAALATAAHLCWTQPGDYTDHAQLARALFAYNRSLVYVDTVLGWIAHYDTFGADPATGEVTAGSYTLPVDRELVTVEALRRPHHDYPAWDLGLREGTPVYAVHGGVVMSLPAGGRCGLGVMVLGHDGFTYVYCHASAVAAAWGDRVSTGALILMSGNTGNSTGPHLHLGIRDADGRDLCPQELLVAWYEGIPLTPNAASSSGCTY